MCSCVCFCQKNPAFFGTHKCYFGEQCATLSRPQKNPAFFGTHNAISGSCVLHCLALKRIPLFLAHTMLFRGSCVQHCLALKRNPLFLTHTMLFRGAMWQGSCSKTYIRVHESPEAAGLSAMRPQAGLFVLLLLLQLLQQCSFCFALIQGVRGVSQLAQHRQVMLHATIVAKSFHPRANPDVAVTVTYNEDTAVSPVLRVLQQQQQERGANIPQAAAAEMLAIVCGGVDTEAAAVGCCATRKATTYCFSEYRPCRKAFRNSNRAPWSEC